MKLNENVDLRFIKKHYGEKFAHLCRSLFPTIMEIEGLLKRIISENFGQTRSLYEDLINNDIKFERFKTFVNTCAIYDIEQAKPKIEKTTEENNPVKLFEKAGYILYPECKKVKDIEKFKKYYADKEIICTFDDVKGRLSAFRIWFAVKKDADKICRSDFTSPSRQDKYGTSVLSLQFDKDTGALSIKNRYNHGRNGEISIPDATFSNNLDNIIPGLAKAFSETYEIDLVGGTISDFKENFNGYICADASDNRLYRSNSSLDDNSDFIIATRDLVFCENNIIVENGDVVKFDKDKFLLFDNFIIDLHKKTITSYSDGNEDSFIKSLGDYRDIIISKPDEFENRTITIVPKEGKNIEIMIDKHNSMISYSNENVTEVGDKFLALCQNVANLNMSNLKKTGNYFMNDNLFLQTCNLQNLEYAGDYFLTCNYGLKELDMPKLKYAGECFLVFNTDIEKVNLQSLEIVKDVFLRTNEKLKTLDLPNLKYIGSKFLSANKNLGYINIPKVETIGDYFLYENEQLKNLNIPLVKTIGIQFLYENRKLKTLNMNNIEKIDDGFLYQNQLLEKLNCPYLTNVGNDFLANNQFIKDVNFPSILSAGEYFLNSANKIRSLNFDSLIDYYNNTFLGALSRSKFKHLIAKIEQRRQENFADSKTTQKCNDDLSK